MENDPGRKMWKSVAISGYSFNLSAPVMLFQQLVVNFPGCQLEAPIPDGATVRVTANVQIYGRFNGKGKADGWFLDRLSKDAY